MAGEKKRKLQEVDNEPAAKRPRKSRQKKKQSLQSNPPPPHLSSPQSLDHPILSSFFPTVSSLRDYFTAVLSRRCNGGRRIRKLEGLTSAEDCELVSLLDRAVVGFDADDLVTAKDLKKDLVEATQRSGMSELSQAEVGLSQIALSRCIPLTASSSSSILCFK